MKKIFVVPLLILLSAASCGDQFKENLINQDRAEIIREADQYLSTTPRTVVHASSPRSEGGLHDFYSEGDYWWPDTTNLDGPYVRRDGQTNPDNFIAHRKFMREMSIIVPALVVAYDLTGDEKYAAHAMKHLNAWFADPETRMTPSLLYAQAIKGRVTGRGIGIIDTIHLVEVVQAILKLKELDYLAETSLADLKNWFREYLSWLTTHPYGIDERDHGNNHSTCWAMQVAQFARLVGDDDQLAFVREMFKTTLLPNQMSTEGSFPDELSRTKPYGYSLFNLDAFTMVCQIASNPSDNLYEFQTSDGKSIKLGLDYLYPFIETKTSWPLPDDIMYHDEWPMRHPLLLFGGIEYQRSEYLNQYLSLPRTSKVDEVLRNYFIRQGLLWI